MILCRREGDGGHAVRHVERVAGDGLVERRGEGAHTGCHVAQVGVLGGGLDEDAKLVAFLVVGLGLALGLGSGLGLGLGVYFPRS